MNLSEIKAAIAAGQTVHWSNPGYVVKDTPNGLLIVFTANGSAIGLTWQDGKTLNGKESEFFIGLN